MSSSGHRSSQLPRLVGRELCDYCPSSHVATRKAIGRHNLDKAIATPGAAHMCDRVADDLLKRRVMERPEDDEERVEP